METVALLISLLLVGSCVGATIYFALRGNRKLAVFFGICVILWVVYIAAFASKVWWLRLRRERNNPSSEKVVRESPERNKIRDRNAEDA